jgi:hypothetical protein
MKTGRKLVVVLCLLFAAGCKQEADVTITGSISGLVDEDSVFVTLSRDWKHGVVAPVLFNLDPTGRFALKFPVKGKPPPVTFVKNGEVMAQLEFRGPWGYNPKLADKVSGNKFPVVIAGLGRLKADVQF